MEFIDLKTQYKRIHDDVHARIDAVLEHGHFIMGPEIAELETKLASRVGRKHCISCANGTDALYMSLLALGVGPGDAVFIPTFTFIATAEVVALLGATPVFVDIDEKTFNMSLEHLRHLVACIAKGKKPSSGSPSGLRPKCIIPVDLFGLCADYQGIQSVADQYGLFVLEDAAQSYGASHKGVCACAFGTVSTTSFFPAKPLGCYGDGGAIFTDDDKLAGILCSIRVHGKGSDKYDNIRIGLNGRLDTLQAAILLSKLTIFQAELQAKQIVAQRYSHLLKDVVETPQIPEGNVSAWAQYTIRSNKRDKIMQGLKNNKIPSTVYYPKPLHLQTAFSYLSYKQGEFPASEQTCSEVLSLPMHAYLSEEEQISICNAIKQIVQ